VTGTSFQQLNKLHDLKFLFVSSSKFDDTGLKALGVFPKLFFLYMEYSKATGQDLSVFQQLPYIHTLSPMGINIQGRGLQQLNHLSRMHCFDIKEAGVTEKDLVLLSEFKNLQSMFLGHEHLTANGIAALKNVRLNEVYLDGRKFDDASLQHLSELTTLRELNLINTSITDAGVRSLAGMKNLTTLRLSDSTISEQALVELEKTVPFLEVVKM
jgi:internalin A